ncbi:hypothetical protein ZWY2020_052036 [Hordeum vulgare]|nr:hypothetical protein ZWY2020_052036 [Hordeum vulgare]
MAHISLPYNAILGYPTLARFMATTHPGYNIVKIPGSNGVLTVSCDERNAMNCLKQARGAAVWAAMCATSRGEAMPPESLLETAPSRKKLQLAQDQTKMKKLPLNDDSLGPTFTIGADLPTEQENTLIAFLRSNGDVSVWKATDLTGVPRDTIEHHLEVCPNARPVK